MRSRKPCSRSADVGRRKISARARPRRAQRAGGRRRRAIVAWRRAPASICSNVKSRRVPKARNTPGGSPGSTHKRVRRTREECTERSRITGAARGVLIGLRIETHRLMPTADPQRRKPRSGQARRARPLRSPQPRPRCCARRPSRGSEVVLGAQGASRYLSTRPCPSRPSGHRGRRNRLGVPVAQRSTMRCGRASATH